MTRGCGKICGEMRLMSKMKNRAEEPVGKLKLSEVPQETWTHLTVDFITKLTGSSRKRHSTSGV